MKAGVLVPNSGPGLFHSWGLSKRKGRRIIILLLQRRTDGQEDLPTVVQLV